MRSDDVRSSLDLLDRVIGEFDDGLLSSTESESPISRPSSKRGGVENRQSRQHNDVERTQIRHQLDDDNESHIEAEIRRQPPPKGARRNEKPSTNGLPNRRTTLNDKIDDIFSELTEEVYQPPVEVTRRPSPGPVRRPPTAVAPKNDATSQWVAKHRQRSPVRRMNDPLPSPPLPPTMDGHRESKSSTGAVPKVKDEVVVYSIDRQDSNAAELFSLKKSVKAQIHSLEAKSAMKEISGNGSGRGAKDGNRNPAQRSRSENPPLSRGDRSSPTQPPPMPEKVKIHLKNNLSMERNPVAGNVSNTSSAEKMKKSPYGRYDKSKKTTQNMAISSVGKLTKNESITKSGMETGKAVPDKVGSESRQQQIRRARSVGPVVEAAQRELSHLDLTKILGNGNPGHTGSAGKSGGPSTGSPSHTALPKERRSRSRGRVENNTTGSNSRPKTSNGVSVGEGSRLKSDLGFNPDRKPVGMKSPPSPVDMSPRHVSGKLPSRQKSMIDLREPYWDAPRHKVHPVQIGRIPVGGGSSTQPPRGGPTPGLVRSATEHDIRLRSRRPGPEGRGGPPFGELPPHIRQHMIRQHGFRLGEAGSESMFGLDQASLSRHAINKEGDPFVSRHLEAQREFLVRRGFSPTHPYISGEVPIHPELQGQLPFNVPSRTIPMRPEDYRRFKPELWLQDHNPNPVPFNDIAVLQSELELRRRREIYRQSSQRRAGGGPDMDSTNFTSLPWDEIIPRRQMEQFQHQLQQHMMEQQQQMIIQQQQQQQRSRSQDPRKKNRPFSLFGGGPGSGWFNPGQVLHESDNIEIPNSTRVKKQGHWVLKERSPSEQQLQSMPPINVGSLKDSGIGTEDPEIFTRSGAQRSSFGMALKDKFQRNPNMYFPPDGRSPGARASSSGSSGEKRHSMASKSTSMDDLSDTDTLIHNMSEGSFEKDRTSLGSGGHNSLGSASGKGSRSSGNSSLSPHNSMEGSPRMIPRQAAKFQPSPSVTPLGTKSATSSGVSFNKKTIRNYTPQASSNMLREFEDRRNNSMDWRDKEKRGSSQPSELHSTPLGSSNRVLKTSQSNEERQFEISDVSEIRHAISTSKLSSDEFDSKRDSSNHSRRTSSSAKRDAPVTIVEEDKTAMERMIEDFHRNLPPPPIDSRQQKPAGRVSDLIENPTLAPSTTTASSSKRTSKHGTLNSQISNWSAASSVASFDYQPARYGTDSHSVLPALTEVEYVTNANDTPPSRSRNHTPKGERVPPEGASADSPKPFVQRIEIGPVVSEKRTEKSSSSNPRSKSKSSTAIDEVKDLLYPPESANGEPDEFSNLRKLISEGRISGLSDKPPSFVPPTPPNAKRISVGSRKEGGASAATGIEKKPSRSSADRPRKAREAPKPPTTAHQNSPSPTKSVLPVKTGNASPPLQQPPINPDVKLLTSRHRESLEDLTQMETRRRRNSNAEVKRSSSNHGVRPSGFDPRSANLEDTTAQLIADSTEKKFNFNPFKGMWKKKHYSFDFN